MRTPSDYQAKLTSLFTPQKAPLFNAVIEMVMQPFSDIQAVLNSLPQVFDLDQAIGAQLDIDGKWVGITREIQVQKPVPYFSFGIPNYGFGTGLPFYNEGQPKYTTITYELPDDNDTGYGGFASYRNLIRGKIQANGWDGTNGGIVNALTAYFTNMLIFAMDDQYQTLKANVYFPYASGLYGMVIPDFAIFSSNYIPTKTAGVQYNYRIAVPGPIFGFGMDNNYCSGFGKGCWGVNPQFYIDKWFGYNTALSAIGSCSMICGDTSVLRGKTELGVATLITLNGKL